MTNTREYQPAEVDWANKPAANGDHSEELKGDVHPIPDRYNTHDASFRRHYQLNYHDNAHSYEEFYAPAYRFGFQLAEDSSGAEWEVTKAEAERHWQTNYPSPWTEVADAVHYGWLEQRNPDALRVHHYGEFEAYRAGFLHHHQTELDGSGLAFDHYEPAYQYGYTLAIDPTYNTHEWSEIEPEVRKYYETEYAEGQVPWEHYRNAAQHAWHGVRATIL